MSLPETLPEIQVSTFYRFVRLLDRRELRGRLRRVAEEAGVLGTILLAEEGINGTLAGPPEAVRQVLDALREDPRFEGLETKDSWAAEAPFYRLRVRLKREIITMGRPDLDPGTQAGTYVKPAEWNALLDDPEVVVIDARNGYETVIGTFEGAVDPATESFSELPEWLDTYAPLRTKPRVAMFCTGGIRCEKATALLRNEGFAEVFHLEGGILKYLEEVPEEESRWRGECFVFDQRVAVGHGLELGEHELCHACRWPVSPGDRRSERYEPGVSCPRCHGRWTEDQRLRFRTRQRQMELAAERGQRHLGQLFSDQPAGGSSPEAADRG